VKSWYRRRGKRIVDAAGAGLGLMICALPMALIALAVRLRMGPPVIFRQTRAGLRGKPFTILKFRTMTEEADTAGDLLPDSERLTRFGRRLRRTSLDELPELWNVLRGEMSLVGPRPLTSKYLPLYTTEQARRHDVRPGITGWAQVNGRNAISWEEKFRLDVWYVENVSVWLDIRIVWRTAVNVFRREGIAQAGQATAEVFKGSSHA
jgi:sugar transferase EpsL